MSFARAAGLLLHPTSLPGAGGIGDFGPDAHRFVQWLADAGLKIWQVLPLGPTGYGDSPYQCFSAFAGNPLLIHVPGFSIPSGASDRTVDFGAVIPAKQAALAAWLDTIPFDERIRQFVQEQQQWLPDYALFMALKEAHGGVSWTAWEAGARQRDPQALDGWRRQLAAPIERIYKEQCVFYAQFHALRHACRERGIQLMGDVPIYVAHDSADVWANPSLFQLHDDGTLKVQAGVPPDYFSETGQLWGNPLYDWERMAAEGYRWWIARMRAGLALFDLVRLDHFRGFEAYWEVPGDAPTAVNGRWVKGPGATLFQALTNALGALPIIAENLGLITPEVETLRAQLGYPGMAILQFAFDGQDSNFIPHRYVRDLVVYTGTHDNDTTLGWWQSSGAGDSTRSADTVAREKAFARRYLDTDGSEMHWTLIRATLASVANTVLIPMQDVLGLGSDARMNLPGRQAGNWGFRFSWAQLTPDLTERLHTLTTTYER
ncbi:4-alpha-glucanotransferase [Gemmatimonas sp.]|jgi:4-alpha-glucanotransferase|uniref:4-alpha-glucanotransferase n=1 Tax=Gemmatimonas sp. TaxID=1962908 RepID=UPI0022C5E682|nr:4-alpha-glucanotransferase [Gemmatimonas sp.]MCZ8203931.1 4-alpha-glucanotransferase [Gemmatimonas sp.]